MDIQEQAISKKQQMMDFCVGKALEILKESIETRAEHLSDDKMRIMGTVLMIHWWKRLTRGNNNIIHNAIKLAGVFSHDISIIDTTPTFFITYRSVIFSKKLVIVNAIGAIYAINRIGSYDFILIKVKYCITRI